MFEVRGQKIALESKHSFTQVLGEIRMDVYDFDLADIQNGDVIVDIGAHIGIFSCYAAAKYPNAKVYAFEPAAETFADLQKNVSAYPNITAFNMGVSDKPELTLQYLPHMNYSTSAHYSKDVAGAVEETVKCLTLDEIIEMVGDIKFLKIDCEGAEWDVIPQCKQLGRVKYLSCELHTGLPCTDEAAFRAAIRPHFTMGTFKAHRVEKELAEGV
jgi:FkbM family methyltransferase